MKTKTDFVTNSSTTCFFIWGVQLSSDDLLNNEKLLKIVYEKYKDQGNNITFEEFKHLDLYIITEFIEYKLAKNLEVSRGPWGDDFWIGGAVSRLKDDQTLGDYKKEIIKSLNEIGIEVDKVYLIEEAWRNG